MTDPAVEGAVGARLRSNLDCDKRSRWRKVAGEKREKIRREKESEHQDRGAWLQCVAGTAIAEETAVNWRPEEGKGNGLIDCVEPMGRGRTQSQVKRGRPCRLRGHRICSPKRRVPEGRVIWW